MSPVDIMAIVKDVALSGAACVTGYVAIVGLGAWREELEGRANFDAARQLARSVYVLRDQMAHCRSSFITVQEFPEGYQGGLGNVTSKEEGDAWSHVYSNRREPVDNAVREFDAASLEAEALWGDGVKEKCTELRKCVESLHIAIDRFISDKYGGGKSFEDQGFARKIKAEIWDMNDDDNEHSKRINAAICGIESFLRPHLSRT